jgi:hypothetical protein
LFDGNFFPDVLFGDAEFFFDRQLYGQPVGIPSAFALYATPVEGMVAAKQILYRPGHHVVNTRFAVGRGGPFVKHETAVGWALLNTLPKNLLIFPELPDFCVDAWKM